MNFNYAEIRSWHNIIIERTKVSSRYGYDEEYCKLAFTPADSSSVVIFDIFVSIHAWPMSTRGVKFSEGGVHFMTSFALLGYKRVM